MRVLVTGGNGFIGRYVVEALKDRGHEPVIFDRTSADIQGDIRDGVAISQAVGECDAVMHLAGLLGTSETVPDPRAAVRVNIDGGINVFEAIAKHQIPAVNICAANDWMWNPYSITKKAAERFALMYNKEAGARIALVRGMNVYGPGQKSHPVRKIMPNIIEPALRDEPVTIYGDGEQIMDMIYVTDVADIMCRALLDGHDVYDQVMDAGTGRVTTVNDLVKVVFDQLGREVIEGETVKHTKMRPGEPEHSVVLGDPETLEPLGIWEGDLVRLEDGVKMTLASYEPVAVG